MQTIYEFDEQFRINPSFKLCGVDEAGRGPFAGPVCAAAVILPQDFFRLIDEKFCSSIEMRNLSKIIIR